VHLSLPADVLSGAVEDAQQRFPDPESFAPPAEAPRAEELARIREAIAEAQRPVVLCGAAFATSRGRQHLAALAQAIKAPVIALESPRGVNDPSLGALAGVLQRADLVVLLGKRKDFTLRFGRAFSEGCKTLSIGGDKHLLSLPDALATAAGEDRRKTGWLLEAEQEIRRRPQPTGGNGWASTGALHPMEVCEEVQRILDLDQRSVLVCDGGEFAQWAQSCLRAGERLINGPAGAIGPSIPFALSARLERGDAGVVVAMLGDGTFGFHMAEFDTAVRYGLPFIAVIGNDACWNAEYQIQVREYGRKRAVGCELLPARYERVAEALGGHGGYAVNRAQLRSALQDALKSGKPACVNVRTAAVPAPAVK
jgi:acetolactate synthase-1/2/3 large subunit